MARKKPPPAGVPEWIVTYGDMMALLLCFFIMLYAMSTIQEVKIQAAVESLSEAFGYGGATKVPQNVDANATKPRIRTTGRAGRTDTVRGGQPVIAPKGEQSKVQSARIKEEPVRGGIVRFELGSSELSEQNKTDLKEVYQQLVGSPYKIMVKGHASPGEQGIYRDVDDLSYTRARNVRDYLVTLGLKKNYFQLTAVGATEPISRAALPTGADPRSANAVVEVILLLSTNRYLENPAEESEMRMFNEGALPQ
ncbi:MAG: OmpA family protein [Planctomycetaceae bacterium]|nr:OmpA family protein [Planctomycetaceae bacterium]